MQAKTTGCASWRSEQEVTGRGKREKIVLSEFENKKIARLRNRDLSLQVFQELSRGLPAGVSEKAGLDSDQRPRKRCGREKEER